MLKRYQVLMNNWLAEYWQGIASRLDVSFSEMLRLALCKHIIDVTQIAFPRFKAKINQKTFKTIIQNKNAVKELPSDELHALFSRVYFEAQKAAELWK